MKAAKITILLVVILVLMSWSRGDYDHKLPMVLPLLHGSDVGIYDVTSAIMVAIGVIGLIRLSRNRRKDGDQR